MPEQPPAFVVVDKRKYTAEGEIREGFVAPEPEAPRAAPEPPPAEPANVVTMPARDPAATGGSSYDADDLADEDMGGSLSPLESADYDLDTDEPVGEPRSAGETAAQDEAYRQSTRAIDSMLKQANPGMETPGVASFEHVVQSFYLSAIMAMGAGTEPGQKPRIDILGARQSIDMLAVIEEKTRGNLSAQEQQLIQGITFELRMMFLELTNAISNQAHQPGTAGPGSAPPGGGVLR